MENIKFEDNNINANTSSQENSLRFKNQTTNKENYAIKVKEEDSKKITNLEVKDENKKIKKESSLKIVEQPTRVLPKIILEVLNKNFSVVLNKKGYFIEGFYGIKHEEGFSGFIFGQETTEKDTLVFFDAKGHKHYVKTFEELVALNSVVWGQFFKTEEYKKPNSKWFNYMLELGVLNITPSK